MRAAADRAQAAADQVSALMLQGATRGLGEVRRLAADGQVVEFLRAPSPEGTETVRKTLAILNAPGQPPVELWNDAGVRVLDVTARAGAGIPPSDRAPQAPGLSAFRNEGGKVVYEVVGEVDGTPQNDADPSVGRLGYLVVRRALTTVQTADTLNRLLGSGATVAIGNQTGDVWSDFTKAVPGPKLATLQRGSAAYRSPDGSDRIGAVSLIAGTPWATWIDFPRTIVLGPARTFLRRMLLLAALFVAIGTAAVWMISARITTPLHDLTNACEAVAGGRFTERVPEARRDEIGRLGTAFNAMTERVATAHHDLEHRVLERTAELQEALRELEAFSYSVSHDLRAPLRHIIGFATMLDKSAGDGLDPQGRRYLGTIVAAGQRMGRLIDDLLMFSRVSRTSLTKRPVNLNQLAQDVRHELAAGPPTPEWLMHELPTVEADPVLLRMVLVNLMSNAVKYSSKREAPRIEIGTVPAEPGETVVFVRDNGEGFDMKYAHKLFGVFQRLHAQEEFEGTGIGLANVRRIIQRHGGRTWAEGAVNGGATFYFSLPNQG